MDKHAQSGIFGAIVTIASIFVCFILLMAFSHPLSTMFDAIDESANRTSTSIGENVSEVNDMNNKIYSILFGCVMVGGAIALFLGLYLRRTNRPPYDEYERYGGDYYE